MTAHDEAPLTSRSGSAQMHERPANFPTAGEALGASMQDLSDPADAGKAAPPSRDRPFAFVLRDRLADLRVDAIPTVERAVLLVIATYARPDGTNAWPSIAEIRRVTGHSTSRIVEAVKALAAKRWIRCHERYDDKTKARTSTGYTVSLSGDLWPESEGRAKRRATSKLPPGGKATPIPSDAMGTAPLPSGAEPPLRAAQSPLPSGAEPPSVGRNRSAHDQPSNNPSEKPPSAPARGGGVKGKRQTTIPFEPVQPKEEQPKGSAQERYLDAFVSGILDAGHRVSRPRGSDAKLLGKTCGDHAPEIVGDALPPWIRSEAAAFRRAVSQPQFWKGGISVVGLIAWWDAGRPTQAPTFRSRDEVDDFHRPRESDSWPEATLVPDAEPRPRPPDRERTPEELRQIAELAALGTAELERRCAAMPGLPGWR